MDNYNKMKAGDDVNHSQAFFSVSNIYHMRSVTHARILLHIFPINLHTNKYNPPLFCTAELPPPTPRDTPAPYSAHQPTVYTNLIR